MKEFIEGMQGILDNIENNFIKYFGKTSEQFVETIRYVAPEIRRVVENDLNNIQIMKDRIKSAKKVQNGSEISDEEIGQLLAIPAGKECEEIINIAKERGLISNLTCN